MDFGRLIDRMIRASKLDISLYEEVELDSSATSEAVLVVVLVAIAGSLGVAIGRMFGADTPPAGLFGPALGALIAYVIWTGLTLIVGRTVFKGTADMGELLRTIGFAQSPGVLAIASGLPVLGGLVGLAVWAWQLAAGVVAIRQALDLTTGQAVMTAVAASILVMVITLMILVPLGLAAFGLAVLSGG
jgi:hypothetical protein